jgi:hypothetical protein
MLSHILHKLDLAYLTWPFSSCLSRDCDIVHRVPTSVKSLYILSIPLFKPCEIIFPQKRASVQRMAPGLRLVLIATPAASRLSHPHESTNKQVKHRIRATKPTLTIRNLREAEHLWRMAMIWYSLPTSPRL